MPFTKGHCANPTGRPKGTRNKFSELRDYWLKAFKLEGGIKLLRKLAKDDPGTFLKLGVQMLPKEIDAEVHGKLEVSWIGEGDNTV